ncbi:choline-binding protein A [uncultured Veillonella sp.]|uniref:choline-binding protein A n=1 Tax=uncultured Veillonella sp. TaxID=159268 RepID=UPI0028048FFE|nr:choline-binding protein A [uncultured Veillonella sp.]
MENQNILTIKFNTLDDLAVQVADWNERLNHQCCGNCSDVEAPTVAVSETINVEVEAPEVVEKVDTKPQTEPEPVEVVPVQEDVPVTDFEGKPTKTKKEEKVELVTESVVEPDPAETPTEEPATIQTPEQDAALDVTAEPVDKKAFYKEFREWMGEDGVKAKKALAIFSKHGVTRPSSDSLTDDLITDLKSIMAEKEA